MGITEKDILKTVLKVPQLETQLKSIIQDGVSNNEINKIEDLFNKEYNFDFPFDTSYEPYANAQGSALYLNKIIIKDGKMHINALIRKKDMSANNYISTIFPYECITLKESQLSTTSFNSAWTSLKPAIIKFYQGKLGFDTDCFTVIGGGDKSNVAYVPINIVIDLQKCVGWTPSNLTKVADIKTRDDVSKMVFMADLHFKEDENNKKKINLFNNVVSETIANGGIVLGDVINESYYSNNKTKLINAIKTVRRCLVENTLIVGGNHDTNSYGSTAEKSMVLMPFELYKEHMLGKIGFTSTKEGKKRLYYYYDDNKNGVRYVILNSCDVPQIELNATTWKYKSAYNPNFGQEQIRWLCDVALKTNKDIVICSHHGLLNADEIEFHDNILPKNRDLVRRILKAYKNREKGSVSNTDGDFSASADYDFRNVEGNIVCSIFGHYHFQCNYLDSDGLRHICVDDMLGETNMYNVTKPYTKDFARNVTSDDTNATCKVMVIDTELKRCELVNIGAGEDITFVY